jgi:predicted DNA-binding ribbon-helix-helix protein
MKLGTRIPAKSVSLRGVRTSVSLEYEFWFALKEIADEKSLRRSQLVEQIDRDRKGTNLSSTLRMYVLSYYKSRMSDR